MQGKMYSNYDKVEKFAAKVPLKERYSIPKQKDIKNHFRPFLTAV
jgi:hypothetical protein